MANKFLLWYRFQRVTARGYFDEAVEDEEELREMGGNNSDKDIFLTLATDFLTEAPGFGTSFPKFGSSKFGSPSIEFFIVNLRALP